VSEALAGARRKLDRGKAHVDDLTRRSLGNTSGPDPVSITTRKELDLKDKSFVIRVDSVIPNIPDNLDLVGVEAATHFRSALNYVIAELAWVDSRGNSKVADIAQSFPIVASRNGWKEKWVSGALDGLTQRHRAIVQRFQPYRPWNGREPHPLLFLKHLTDDDKHRLFHASELYLGSIIPAFALLGTNCRVNRRRLHARNRPSYAGTRLEPDAEIARIPIIITGPDPDLDVQIRGHGYVAIGRGLSVIDYLDDVAAIVEKVIQTFEGEFDRPIAKRIWRVRAGKIDKLPASESRPIKYQTVKGRPDLSTWRPPTPKI
jgi:hypothetical protein